MSDGWTVDFLTVSRRPDPPADPVVIRALTGAGCGTVEYAAAPPAEGTPARERQRLGTYTLREPQGHATGRIVVTRHERPVVAEMGDTAFETLTRGLDADDVLTLREGQLAIDLRVRVLNAANGVYLAWATRVLLVLLGLTEGAAIDPAMQRGFGRTGLARLAAATDPLAHVAIHAEPRGSEAYWLHTHGLQKFARPDLEMVGVPLPYEAEGRALLSDVAGHLARGSTLAGGQEIDMDELGRLVALVVPADLDHQSPYGRLRLVDEPAPGEPLGTTAQRLLARTVLADAWRRGERGDVAGALDAVERMLSVDPDDCAALAFKAQLFLRQGRPHEALEIGELMELRAPNDARGPVVVGQALGVLGRAREAARAFSRAIELSPDDAEAFAGRAAAYARLGQDREAAVDQARATYLRTQVIASR